METEDKINDEVPNNQFLIDLSTEANGLEEINYLRVLMQ